MSRYDLENEPDERSGRTVPSRKDSRELTKSKRSKHAVDRERTYELRDSEIKTLTDIGSFRALNLNDVVTHRYGGNMDEARRDLDNLERQGLLLRRTIYPDNVTYVTLTKSAHTLIEAKQSGKAGGAQQVFYHGFVKDREARHDVAIYRLYQQEAARIERAGGKVERVILDFELKRSVNRKLARLQSLPPAEQAKRKQEIADEHHLPVVNGRISLPDLRLEYEGPDQERGRVDLELVTGDYHHKGLARKTQAGFQMYGLPEDEARLRPALSDPEIMMDILSL